MADSFRIIAVTRPELFEGEAALIELMLRRGIDRVHVRKPGASEAGVRSVLVAIAPELRDRLSVHGFQALAVEYGAGVHLNAANPVPPAGFSGLVSRSCHSLPELADDVDYQFLSPVFNSISKSGYESKFRLETLRVSNRTIALGGVTPERFGELRRAGFGGAAMLGWIWADNDMETIKNRIDVAVYNSHQQ